MVTSVKSAGSQQATDSKKRFRPVTRSSFFSEAAMLVIEIQLGSRRDFEMVFLKGRRNEVLSKRCAVTRS